MQRVIDAEKSDLFDVLAHVAYALPPLTPATPCRLSSTPDLSPATPCLSASTPGLSPATSSCP